MMNQPILGLERPNTAVDVRHARRELTSSEIALLVKTARESQCSISGYFWRAMCSPLLIPSYMTGLRRKELGYDPKRPGACGDCIQN